MPSTSNNSIVKPTWLQSEHGVAEFDCLVRQLGGCLSAVAAEPSLK
jgi:hypothetical protein